MVFPAVARLRADVSAMAREIHDYRDLLAALTRRDLMLRYKQTAMGVAWAVLGPVAQMLLFTVIFTKVTTLRTDLPYPVYAYAGLLPWNLTASALRFATVSLTGNTALLNRTSFPREVLPLSTVLVALVDFLVAATVLVGLMVYFGIGISWTVLLVPLVILVQLSFTAGVALLLAMANLFFRDVRHLVDVLILVWMLASAVVYPIERIGGALGRLFALNPMTPIIEAYRAVLLRGEPPAALPFAYAATVALVTLCIGWFLFHRAELRFAENI